MTSWRDRKLPGFGHTTIARWHHDPRLRLIVSLTLGALGIWLASRFWTWSLALLIGWVVIGTLYCLITAVAVWPMNAVETAAHATAESPGGLTVHVMLLSAAAISLVGLIVLIAQPQTDPVESAVITFFVVLVSWATIQIIYALRYARQYYLDGGGINFSQDTDPQYSDFAYVAITIGMTFQTSDPVFTNTAIRRVVIGQALLAFVFGTGFLASAVNVLQSLGGN